MTEAAITPDVLRWARLRVNLDPAELAERTKFKLEKVAGWEAGAARPTLNQAEKLAAALRVPLGYLFLPRPPKEKLAIPDLRTMGGRPIVSPSADLTEFLHDALRKQEWYRDYRLSVGMGPLPFVGSATVASTYAVVASEIRDVFGINDDLRRSCSDPAGYLTSLVREAEEQGILVLRSGVVKHNTKRPLSVDEFRGFAVSDDIAPLIAINNADWPAARVFTLVHELAHLWLGASGISNVDLMSLNEEKRQETEVFCNAVAAEVLLPKKDFARAWRPAESARLNVARMAKAFRVSSFVVAFRAREFEAIPRREFRELVGSLQPNTKRRSSSGGNFYNNLLARNGRAFTAAVVSSALEGQLLHREAASLLGTTVPVLLRAADHLEIN